MKNKNNLNTTDIIRELQNNPDSSYSDLAKKFNCTKNSIYYFMRQNKLLTIKEKLKSFNEDIKYEENNQLFLRIENLEKRIDQLEKKSKFSFFNLFKK